MNSATSPQPIVAVHPGALRLDRIAFFLVATAVFLSPYNVLRHPSLYFTVADFLMLLTFYVLLAGGRLPLAPFGHSTPIWYAALLAIIFGMLIGAMVHQRMVAGSNVISQYLFAMIILPWVLCGWGYVRTRRLLLIWVVSIVIVMLQGLYLTEFVSDPPESLLTGSGRYSGVLERENALAAIGAITIVVTLYMSADGILSRPVTLLFLAILIYGLVLTASNTGLLTTTAGIITFSLLQRSRSYYVTLAVICGLVVIALIAGGEELLPKAFMRRVAGALTSGDLDQAGTFDDRMDLARIGWRLSADHVLIGLGPDGFRVATNGPPVHNTYILLLVEGGFLSLVGLCAIVALIILSGVTILPSTRTRNLGAMVVAVGVQLALVLNTIAHIYARFWYVPLILVLTLAIIARQSPNSGREAIHKD